MHPMEIGIESIHNKFIDTIKFSCYSSLTITAFFFTEGLNIFFSRKNFQPSFPDVLVTSSRDVSWSSNSLLLFCYVLVFKPRFRVSALLFPASYSLSAVRRLPFRALFAAFSHTEERTRVVSAVVRFPPNSFPGQAWSVLER